MRQDWYQTLARLSERPDVNGQLVGRFVRLLFDAQLLDDVAVRLHRALSYGASAAAKAAWVDGFFADGAVLLIHDTELRRLLDDWILGLSDDEFVGVLPLVRRTFGTFSPSDRRSVAGRLASGRASTADVQQPDETEPELAGPAMATVALILSRSHSIAEQGLGP